MRYQRRRNLVTRHADQRLVNVARPRGQIFVCYENCCCGRTEDGFAPVPADLYHDEWERRRLRNMVHLTVGGCLGPCALANVALLLFDGEAIWLHSMNTSERVLALYDYIEQMLDADRYLPPPGVLAQSHFTASAWQDRPDGAPVDDLRPRRTQLKASDVVLGAACELPERAEPDRVIADMQGAEAAPRRNGELVFEAPWEGRAFGMAIALNEGQLYDWDEFREQLIASIARAEATEARNGAGTVVTTDAQSGYYERWLGSLERVLVAKGLVTTEELDERTYQFEFGERDDVF